MTIETLQAKLDDVVKVRQMHLDNANAAQGAIQMLQVLIKEETENSTLPTKEE